MRKRILAGTLAILTILILLPAMALAADPIEKVYFDETSIVMGSNEAYSINVTTTPRNADKTTLQWTVDDSRIATVSNGVIRTKGVYGGCIVTATAPNGSTAMLYVGVGAPYGYTGGSYSGYYPGDWSSTYYPAYNGSYYYGPSTYYPGSYYYPNNSVYYNDYYLDGYYYPDTYSTYIDRYGKVIYSIDKDNPITYVRPGTAVSANQFALEVQQGIDTSYDGKSVGFGYVQANSSLVITPERTGTKKNSVSIPSRTLSRLDKYSLNSVKYRLPDIEVIMTEDLDISSAFTLSVKKVTSEFADGDVYVGPYEISVPSTEQGLGIRFILDRKVAKDGIRVVKIDKNGDFKDINSDLWVLKRSNAPGYQTYLVEVSNDLSQGTFAVIKK